MNVKEMISTGAMLLIGVIALKAFGGIQGITTMVSGLGNLLGTGGGSAGGAAGGSAGDVGIISAGTAAQIDIISDMETAEVALIADTQQVEAEADILQVAAGIVAGPFGFLASPIIIEPMEKREKANVMQKYVERTSGAYTPSPSVSTPEGPPAWIQEPDMVSDPARPEGSFGGR